jgi:hypothetical protein
MANAPLAAIGTATWIGLPIARTLGNCLSMSNIEAPEALALGLLNEGGA